MTFDQWCAQYDVTLAERVRLVRYLAILRYEATLVALASKENR